MLIIVEIKCLHAGITSKKSLSDANLKCLYYKHNIIMSFFFFS